MAAGDPQKIWFPEMIEQLRTQWHPDMPFESIMTLRDELDATLQRIRFEGRIRPPVIRCHCGYIGRPEGSHLSVRALILSLHRFGIAPEPTFALEKNWAAHRRENGLDPYGTPVTSDPAPRNACGHPPPRNQAQSM